MGEQRPALCVVQPHRHRLGAAGAVALAGESQHAVQRTRLLLRVPAPLVEASVGLTAAPGGDVATLFPREPGLAGTPPAGTIVFYAAPGYTANLAQPFGATVGELEGTAIVAGKRLSITGDIVADAPTAFADSPCAPGRRPRRIAGWARTA